MICDYFPMLIVFGTLAGLCAGSGITWCIMRFKYRHEISNYRYFERSLHDMRGTPADGS